MRAVASIVASTWRSTGPFAAVKSRYTAAHKERASFECLEGEIHAGAHVTHRFDDDSDREHPRKEKRTGRRTDNRHLSPPARGQAPVEAGFRAMLNGCGTRDSGQRETRGDEMGRTGDWRPGYRSLSVGPIGGLREFQ